MNTLLKQIYLLLISCFLANCSNPTDTAWDWWEDSHTQVRFLSRDWKYPRKNYTAGDSLTIGLVDFVRGNETDRNKWALLFTTTGDTESVYLWDRPIPTEFYFGAVLIVIGTRFPTRTSDYAESYNGILEIQLSHDPVVLLYETPDSNTLPGQVLVLSDTTTVIRR